MAGTNDKTNASIFYSTGIHPWHSDMQTNIYDILLDIKNRAINDSRMVAIGEIGLDWSAKYNRNKQIDLLDLQLNIAYETSKPIIIHCVRAFNEVFRLLDSHNISSKVIFHAFRGNAHITKQLIDREYYVSMGVRSFSLPDKVLNLIPKEKILIETDNHPTDIKHVYSELARRYLTSETSFTHQVFSNFSTVFPQCTRAYFYRL